MEIQEEERAAFAREGVCCIKGYIPKVFTVAARDSLFRELTRLSLRENGKWHTKKLDGIPPFQVTTRISQKLKHQKEFDSVLPKELLIILQELAACKLTSTQPQILITPPQKLVWVFPEMGWHVDIATPTTNKIPGIQVFVLLDDVAPRGGGTLAIKGSHISKDRMPSADRVLEMSGKAGDLYIMDMRVLHAPSINASTNARMMLTSRFLANT